MIFFSPTEPRKIRNALPGRTSPICEKRGCDYLLRGSEMTIGIQRKTTADLASSVQDGRIQKEIMQMDDLDVAVLLYEGRPEDVYGLDYTRWSAKAIRNLLLSIQRQGLILEQTADHHNTIERIRELAEYADTEHQTLSVRPKNIRNAWGQQTERAVRLFMLQGFPGVGPALAEAILDHFCGSLPFGWACEREELEEISGIGEKRAKAIWEHLI